MYNYLVSCRTYLQREGEREALVIQNMAEILVSEPGYILQLSQSCKEKSSVV
jgi:hypothetical protein